MKNVTIKIEAEALLKLVELGYGFEVIGNTHIPGAINIPKLIDAPQFIHPYFREPPVMNVPKYDVVNLGDIVVNYLLEIKESQQYNTNRDAFHSNRTSGIYHDVLNYQYFDNTFIANWQFKNGENGVLELHHPATNGDYLSVENGVLFYHYLNRITGNFGKLPIDQADGLICPTVTMLLNSAIEWGADNPVAVLSYSVSDVDTMIQAQHNAENIDAVVRTQPTDNEVITPNEIVRTRTVYVEGLLAETKPEVSSVPVSDVTEEVEVATGEPITVDGKTLDIITKVISVVEGYVDSRKEKKRNTKLYTSQLSAISNAFDFAMLRLNAATDLSAIKQYEHKLNILKDELNCLNISIVSNIENPLYYVNTLLKYYK